MIDHRHFHISGRACLDGPGYTVAVYNAINMPVWLPELHENGRPKVFKEFGVAVDTARRAIDRLLSEPIKTADDSELEALRSELAAARERIAELEASLREMVNLVVEYIAGLKHYAYPGWAAHSLDEQQIDAAFKLLEGETKS